MAKFCSKMHPGIGTVAQQLRALANPENLDLTTAVSNTSPVGMMLIYTKK